jgi:hypothetical protein
MLGARNVLWDQQTEGSCQVVIAFGPDSKHVCGPLRGDVRGIAPVTGWSLRS